jgi:twitching motility two-component system response regulator PilH
LARKILLADDSVTAQNMGRKILADAGYEVITVNNGSAALKKIGETRPDLIVLDVYMPGYSGLEVCQRLKEVGETSRIPILLTVGKLEPFKPEEAKRVRADAFIVKPFEASELLSALSKLEDKVVPRADSSKPGRFARATAAIEESRYDKTMAGEEDDSGWKSRISFPKKKKEKPPEQEVETGEIYNAVNKDLRTTVAHKPEHKVEEAAPAPPAAGQASEEHTPAAHTDKPHVNLGALAPEGLPKDVTAEEIAALAAAAAQIKGKIVDEKPAPAPEPAATAAIETAKSESVAAEKTESIATAETHEHKKEETHPVEPSPVPETAVAAPATLAAQDTQEKTEEKKPEHKSGPAEVMAAIAGLETEWISLPAAGLGNPSFTGRSGKDSAEPVTMAVAAPAESAAPAPAHWTAVAVAVAPEEASISLEQEMQKAYAAFAAAESGHAVAQVPETPPAVAEASTTAVAELPVAEPVATQASEAIPATSAPEAVQSLAAVSEIAADAVSAAVKELEAVAAKYEAEQKAASAPRDEKSVKAEALESPAVASVPEPKIEEGEAKTGQMAELAVVAPPVEEKTEETGPDYTKTQEIKAPEIEPPQGVDVAPPIEAVAPPIESEKIESENIVPQETAPEVHAQSENPAPVSESPEAVAKHEHQDEKSTSEDVSGEPAPVSSASPAGGSDDMAKRESDTAAAWASWRKIRETGGSKSGQSAETSQKDAEESLPQDRAAMAVAAGAESKPEEATNFDADPEIASIVDSVLADMRPKIVEEIARKLGKKK